MLIQNSSGVCMIHVYRGGLKVERQGGCDTERRHRRGVSNMIRFAKKWLDLSQRCQRRAEEGRRPANISSGFWFCS